MPKPSRRPAQPDAPQPSQVAAVRRALDEGHLPQARQRRAALRAAFPVFKPLRGLAWEVASRSGDPLVAAARAWEWHGAVPGSRAALQALHDSTLAAGLVAMHLSARRRLLTLDGAGDLPPVEDLNTPLGRLSFEHAQALDLSRMHLADNQPDAAAAVLQGVDHPSASNNLAVALFMTGRVAQARDLAEAAWRDHPNNLFALELALRWRCWTSGLDDTCLGFVPTLRQAQPGRAEDAIARVAALRFLGDEEAAHQAVEDSQDAPYWGQATREQREMFEELGGSAGPLPGDHATWFPQRWFQAVTALARESAQDHGDAAEARWAAGLGECDAHPTYLERAAELDDAAIRLLALAVLKQRAAKADAAALASLRRLLVRPCGPDSVRLELLDWLGTKGLLQRSEPVEILASGKVHTTRAYGLHIHNQPRPSSFSARGQDLHRRSVLAVRRGALHEALALVQQLHAVHPEHPTALNELTVVKEALGHPADEVMALFRQALALAPDYLFARCGLARYLAAQGQVDEARALIDGLLEKTEWHHSEYLSLLLAQRALAVAGGDDTAVSAIDRTIVDLRRRFHG
jgi:tetratricopeptide (TPR) repeat protein